MKKEYILSYKLNQKFASGGILVGVVAGVVAVVVVARDEVDGGGRHW